MPSIHPSAVLAPGAQLGAGCVIGPYAVVCSGVVLEAGVVVGPHAVIGSAPEIAGLAQGTPWLDRSEGSVVIGVGTVIREHVTIQRPARAITRVGGGCLVMSGAYLAHDTQVADDVVLSAGVRLAGHVQVGARANLGMGAVVHQFRVVGGGAMVGMGAVVTRDVPPFAKAYGNPARIKGANTVGLRRVGVAEGDVLRLAAALGVSGGADRAAYATAGLEPAYDWFERSAAHGH